MTLTEAKQSSMKVTWADVDQMVDGANRIVLSTHVNGDGDGYGCELAFSEHLRRLGKEHRILNPSPLSSTYAFLQEYTPFEQYARSTHRSWVKRADLAIIFDIGDFSRLLSLWGDLQADGTAILSFDHHPHKSAHGAIRMVHDSTASATGLLLWNYLTHRSSRNGDPGISAVMAEGLYIAILTDTGSFRFSNTTPETHEMAADLLRRGAKHDQIHRKLYENSSPERMVLMGEVLRSVRYEKNGRVAWFSITRDQLRRSGCTAEDLSGFTEIIRSTRGVEVAVMIQELDVDTCRLNFRSKGPVTVDDLARRFGGGGHPMAAGATVGRPFMEAAAAVVKSVGEAVEKAKRTAS